MKQEYHIKWTFQNSDILFVSISHISTLEELSRILKSSKILHKKPIYKKINMPRKLMTSNNSNCKFDIEIFKQKCKQEKKPQRHNGMCRNIKDIL